MSEETGRRTCFFLREDRQVAFGSSTCFPITHTLAARASPSPSISILNATFWVETARKQMNVATAIAVSKRSDCASSVTGDISTITAKSKLRQPDAGFIRRIIVAFSARAEESRKWLRDRSKPLPDPRPDTELGDQSEGQDESCDPKNRND